MATLGFDGSGPERDALVLYRQGNSLHTSGYSRITRVKVLIALTREVVPCPEELGLCARRAASLRLINSAPSMERRSTCA